MTFSYVIFLGLCVLGSANACIFKNSEQNLDEPQDVASSRSNGGQTNHGVAYAHGGRENFPIWHDTPQPRSSFQCGKGPSCSESRSERFTNDETERIVNGTYTIQNNYPFMANMKFVYDESFDYHICGGAIYDK